MELICNLQPGNAQLLLLLLFLLLCDWRH